MDNIKWLYVGVLVEDWKVKSWTSTKAFDLTQVISQGVPWHSVLDILGEEGWEMCGTQQVGVGTRFWFKRVLRPIE